MNEIVDMEPVVPAFVHSTSDDPSDRDLNGQAAGTDDESGSNRLNTRGVITTYVHYQQKAQR